MRKVVILTAIPIERWAVRAYLPEHEEFVHPKSGTIYDRGIFSSVRGLWEIYVVEMGMGNTSAAVIAQEAIDYLEPSLIFFIGVAGGIKDVRPGDVVASTKIYNYPAGKENEKHFFPRPAIALPAHRLIQRAMAVRSDEKWQARIQGLRLPSPPRAFVGAIAAGERVVSSKTASTALFLKEHYSDALALEMEGYGVLSAANTNRQVEAMVIRGISDTLDDKEQWDNLNYQDIAARHASAFAFEMLAKMAAAEIEPAPAPDSPQTSQTANISDRSADQFQVSASSAESSPLKVFYSYRDTDADKKLIALLKEQLVMLSLTGQIQQWDHSHLLGGANRREKIDQHLYQDDLFIVGLSPAYFGDSECYKEMEEILRQHTQRGARIIPVMLSRVVGIDRLPIGKLQILPRSYKSISDNRAAALAEVADEIIREITGQETDQA